MFQTPLHFSLAVLGQLHGSRPLYDSEDFPLPKLTERILGCEGNEWEPGAGKDEFVESIRIKDSGPQYLILTRQEFQGVRRWGGCDEDEPVNVLSTTLSTLWLFSFMKIQC